MFNILAVAEEAGIFNNIIRTFLGFLCKIIYPMIINAWNLFVALAKTQIFDSSLEGGGVVTVLYTRVGLLLGILMLFRVIFSLIQMLINPEIFADKEKGLFNIVKKAFVVILLLGFVPTIFSVAFRVQTVVMNDNTIGNIIFGKSVGSMDNFGGALSSNLFKIFYTLTPEVADYQLACPTYTLTFMELRDYQTLNLIDECLTSTLPYNYEFGNGIQSGEKNIYVIDFNLNGFLFVAIGGAVLWMIVMYSIYLGARVVQLALLQIIAPIPIIAYLSPGKNDSLIKWAKICLSTFLDMFIRTAIIYFFALIVYLMFESGDEGLNMIANTSGASGTLLVFVQVAIILGALMIAKKLPDVIGEIFPSLGVGKGKLGFGLSWKKMTEGMLGGKAIYGVTSFGARAATVGAAGAAVGGAVGFLGRKGVFSRVGGTLSGLGRGLAAGSKKGGALKNLGNAFSSQAAANRSYAEWKAAGGSNSFSRFRAGVQKKFGMNTVYDRMQENIEKIKGDNEKTKSRASSARSSYSAFDAVANTGKDAKRAAKDFNSIGVNGANYLSNKGLTAKLAAAGITIGPNESFASILERSKSTKERLEARATSIDSKIVELTNQKNNLKPIITTDRYGRKITLTPDSSDIDNQIVELKKQRDKAVEQSERINLGEIEKAVGEARMGEFLVGNVNDGKASGEFDIAMSTAETVLNNLRNTGNGQNDEDANLLQQYIRSVQNVRNSGYDFATQGCITVNGNSYDNAYDLYDAMINKAQEIANKADAIVRDNEEKLRSIQTSKEYISAKADNQHSGGKK